MDLCAIKAARGRGIQPPQCLYSLFVRPLCQIKKCVAGNIKLCIQGDTLAAGRRGFRLLKFNLA